MGGGLVGGLFTVWLLLLTSLFALSTVMPFWAAALVLLVIMAVVTAILLTAGKKRFKTVHSVPEKTIETMKENVEWVKSQSK
jgi:membrane protein implicated in regulation of membrane protease activity